MSKTLLLKLTISVLISLTFSTLQAQQDTILLKTGSKLVVRILDVNASTVRYQDNNGMLSKINIEEVQSVKYKDGGKMRSVIKNPDLKVEQSAFFGPRFYEGGKRITRDVFHDKIKNNKVALQYFEKGSGQKTFGLLTGLGGGFCLGYGLSTVLTKGALQTSDGVLIGAGAVLTLMSVSLESKAYKSFQNAASAFNTNQTPAVGMKLQLTGGSVGLVVVF